MRFAGRGGRFRRSGGRVGSRVSRGRSWISRGIGGRHCVGGRSGLGRHCVSSRSGVGGRSSRLFRAGGQRQSGGRSSHNEHQFERHRTDPSDGSFPPRARTLVPGGVRLIGRGAEKYKMLNHCELYSLVSGRLKSRPKRSSRRASGAARTGKLSIVRSDARALNPFALTTHGRIRMQRLQTATGALMCASGA